jgi:Rrf2 family iron-sulfur cluster assembly transcriptional regulator
MVSINSLSEAEGLSPIFLEQIFFKLKKAGIVKSVRGPGGGFNFNRPPESISVREILDAAGEELTVLPCDRSTTDCIRGNDCLAHNVLDAVNSLVNDYLGKLTLKTVLESGEFKAVAKKKGKSA